MSRWTARQERDLEDHDPVGTGEAVLAGDHLDADRRVGDRVEIGERVRVAEDQVGERGPDHPALGVEDPRSEPVDERLIGRAVRLDHLAGDQVRVDQCGAPLLEHRGHRRLPGPDAAGEPDREHRFFSAPAPAAAVGTQWRRGPSWWDRSRR